MRFSDLGFQIVNADREAGFVTAEKQTSGVATAVLTGNNHYDHLMPPMTRGSE